ncbi:MAG: glycoside hydrolase family 25 [Lachnospiraceae bacterium]|nr:glycoside hydrolase family 25 [Lachnospiraceae bacterium]
MAKKKKRRRRHADFQPLIVILPAIAGVILIIVLVVLILKKDTTQPAAAESVVSQETTAQEAETSGTQDADGTETENADSVESQEETTVSAEAAGSESGAADAAGQVEEDAEAGSTAAEESVVAAEVGTMDDAEDPQTSTKTAQNVGTGATVEVSTVQIPEGETAEATLGIDVSKYQGTIDWAAVKNAGVDFAMIRVGYRTKTTGIIYEDPGARYNLQEATKNGIKVGAYFFSTAVSQQEAKEEAAWVASFISKYKITYPVAFNCEGFQSSDSRQYNLTKEERTNLACAFLDTIAASGYTPMFYASRNEMEGSAQWNMNTLENRYRVWVSQYPEKPFPQTGASSYSGKHAMWQYTSQGTVAGIKGKVDVNVAYFGYSQEAEAKDSAPAEIVEANPEVGLNFTEVNETVTAKNETNLRNIPTTEGSQVVYLLKNGETVQRTGVGSNGWDRVIYNGQKLYAVHNFLTTDISGNAAGGDSASSQTAGTQAGQTNSQNASSGQTSTVGGLTFKAVSEAVTARDKVNLRDLPSTETGKIVGTLSYGEAVVRTGVSGSDDTGWSRLEVNGQVVYASSRLLATSMDYKEQEKPTAENPENGMHFVAASGNVKAKSGETNLRNIPTTGEPSQVVGQLTGDATAVRVGIDKDKGWTKLNYNGQIVYAVTNYLTVVE